MKSTGAVRRIMAVRKEDSLHSSILYGWEGLRRMSACAAVEGVMQMPVLVSRDKQGGGGGLADKRERTRHRSSRRCRGKSVSIGQR